MRASIVTLALALPAAAEDKISCPLVLPQTTVEVRAPAGWTGYSPSIMRLTGYGMMAGPPTSMTYLVPSGPEKIKGSTVNMWAFGAGEEKWVYCTYDDSSVIQISKRMPDRATECVLSHRRDKFGSIGAMTAICR